MTSQDTELLSKVKELEQRLGAIERWNQSRRIVSDGITIIDEKGLVSEGNFGIFSLSDAPFTDFTNTTYQDRSSPITISVPRNTKVLVNISVVGASFATSSSSDANGRTYYTLYSDISGYLATLYYDTSYVAATGIKENIISKTYSTTTAVTLGPGTHNITLQSKLAFNTNLTSTINDFDISITSLGI